MKNISFHCLPQVYLVPKKFHCGVKVSPQVGNQEYSTFNNYLNLVSKTDSLDKSEDSWLVSNDDSCAQVEVGNTDMMYKKYVQTSGAVTPKPKDQPFAHEKLTQSIHIVCKATQSERITQFQLITSNKLENIHQKQLESDDGQSTKWCPVDFYERPRNPFKRLEIVNIKYNDPILKSLLLKELNKIDKSGAAVSSGPLTLFYHVTAVNDDSVEITSVLDIVNNKTFLQILLGAEENDEKWEDVLRFIENQLNEKFNKMFVKIDALMSKKK